MIKAIFFDSGDVLAKMDFTSCITEYEAKYSMAKGVLYSSMHDRQYWKDFTLGKISEDVYFEYVTQDFEGELNINELKNSIYSNFTSDLELLDYIRSLEGEFILGIISNNPREWFDYCFKKFGWKEIFGITALSSLLHVRKPDKRIFQYALKQDRVKPDESIYVDDRGDRIDSAKKLGMNIVIFK